MNTELTQADYETIVELIASDALDLPEDQDRQRFIAESVEGSEWTFKTPLMSKVLSFTSHRKAGDAFEAMISDVSDEMARLGGNS